MKRLYSSSFYWTVSLTLSLAVFALYLQPQFLTMLAEQLWACF
jgi:hypothetical protein